MSSKKQNIVCALLLLAAIALVVLHSSQYLPDAAMLTVTVLVARLLLVFGAAVSMMIFAYILRKTFIKPSNEKNTLFNIRVVGSSTAFVVAIVTTIASFSNRVPEGLLQLYLSS